MIDLSIKNSFEVPKPHFSWHKIPQSMVSESPSGTAKVTVAGWAAPLVCLNFHHLFGDENMTTNIEKTQLWP